MESIQNPNNGTSEVQAPTQSQTDPLFGLDVFDDPDGVTEPSQGEGTNTETAPADPFADMQLNERQITAYRKLQSEKDKAFAEYQKLQEQFEKVNPHLTFFYEMLEDDQTLEAFLAERKPELVQQKNIDQLVEESLKKEFGEFDPSADPNSWRSKLYYKRAEEIFENLSSKKSVSSVKQLKEERAKKMAEQKALEEAQRIKAQTEVMQSMKWSDPEYNRFVNWAQSLHPVHLAKLYKFVMNRNPNTRLPDLANQQGFSAPAKTDVQKELDRIFG